MGTKQQQRAEELSQTEQDVEKKNTGQKNKKRMEVKS